MTKRAFVPPKNWAADKAAPGTAAKKRTSARTTTKAGAAKKDSRSAAVSETLSKLSKTDAESAVALFRSGSEKFENLNLSKRTRSSKKTATDEGPLAAIHAMARDMFEVGGIDQKTMREYDELCVPDVPKFSKTMIVQIRKNAKVSQGLFAKYLNTSTSTVQKWESGIKEPSGAAAKLLQIVKKHGIDVLG